jgi:hypothetical protein
VTTVADGVRALEVVAAVNASLAAGAAVVIEAAARR